ncbi:HAL3 halotolerance protein, partial [Thalassiosira pseudonana CCMP1335]
MNNTTPATNRRPRIILGITGSIAAVKGPRLALRLSTELKADVKVVLTRTVEQYFWKEDKAVGTYDAEYEEWQNYTSLQDRVLHIQLRNWADLCLIAPLSAHTLAKMANGLCDDLLSCCFRAWDFGKPVILAPAMNTAMWDHPLTRKQLEKVDTVTIVQPAVKTLACGEVGAGALADL